MVRAFNVFRYSATFSVTPSVSFFFRYGAKVFLFYRAVAILPSTFTSRFVPFLFRVVGAIRVSRRPGNIVFLFRAFHRLFRFLPLFLRQFFLVVPPPRVCDGRGIITSFYLRSWGLSYLPIVVVVYLTSRRLLCSRGQFL